MFAYTTKIDEHYLFFDDTATPVYWYKATACFLNNNYNDALTYYQKAAEAAPYHIQVLNDLGTCYDKLRQTELAKIEYKKALQINPRFSDAIYNLAAVQFNEHHFNQSYSTIKMLPATDKSVKRKQFETTILKAMNDSTMIKK